jgi:hypothetical protein
MARSCKGKKQRFLTPVRKLFIKFDRLKSCAVSGNLRPDIDAMDSDLSKTENAPGHPAPPRTVLQHSRSMSVALQNEDPDEDVVIITKLDSVPFCCHEDLFGMSRHQLVAVALSLNAKLPAALRIDVSHRRPDTSIRHSIELIVGLRREVPPAPKAVRLQPISGSHSLDFNASPPTSPLAARIRTRVPYMSPESPRKLARLDEEDEDEMVIDRPVKRRKLSARTHSLSSVTMPPTHGLGRFPPSLPRKLRRSRAQWGSRPALQRVLRSRGQILPDKMPGNASRGSISSATILSCPRYHPKAKATTTRCGPPTPHQGSCRNAGLLMEISSTESDINTSANSGSPRSTPVRHRTNKYPGRRSSNAEAEEMTSGIGDMSMAGSASAMEICGT